MGRWKEFYGRIEGSPDQGGLFEYQDAWGSEMQVSGGIRLLSWRQDLIVSGSETGATR
jgi:hypothetical protein